MFPDLHALRRFPLHYSPIHSMGRMRVFNFKRFHKVIRHIKKNNNKHSVFSREVERKGKRINDSKVSEFENNHCGDLHIRLSGNKYSNQESFKFEMMPMKLQDFLGSLDVKRIA